MCCGVVDRRPSADTEGLASMSVRRGCCAQRGPSHLPRRSRSRSRSRRRERDAHRCGAAAAAGHGRVLGAVCRAVSGGIVRAAGPHGAQQAVIRRAAVSPRHVQQHVVRVCDRRCRRPGRGPGAPSGKSLPMWVSLTHWLAVLLLGAASGFEVWLPLLPLLLLICLICCFSCYS